MLRAAFYQGGGFGALTRKFVEIFCGVQGPPSHQKTTEISDRLANTIFHNPLKLDVRSTPVGWLYLPPARPLQVCS